MKVVIDIDKVDYKIIKRCTDLFIYENNLFGQLIHRIFNTIKNGTPLPKGHGRLIDADELRSNAVKHKYSNNFCEEHNIDWSINLGMLNILIADAPTIIEAESEEEE